MKRLYAGIAMQEDAKEGTSYIRELEMTIDIGEIGSGICRQFFKDFAIYGLREALIYLEQYEENQFVQKGTHAKAEEIAKKIHERHENTAQ